MLLGLIVFGAGCLLVLLGSSLGSLGIRRAGTCMGVGAFVVLLGAVLVVVAGAQRGWGAFLLTLLATLVGLGGAVVLLLAAGYSLERVLPRVLFPLRRPWLAAAIADPSSVRLTHATRLGGIHAVRLWDDRALVVTSRAESLNKDGCCAEHGYLHAGGESPAVGEFVPRSGRIDQIIPLGRGWWLVDVTPHPDWPNARQPDSPDWTA